MNVLYLDATTGLYGASRVLLTLVRNVDRGIVRPFAILANDVDDGDRRLVRELRAERVPVMLYPLAVLRRNKYLNPRGAAFLARAAMHSTRMAVRIIRKHRIDVVHTNTSTVLTGALAARVAGVPHVWHVHEIFRPSDAKVFPPLLDALATRVVVVSRAAERQLLGQRRALAGKVTVVRDGVDARPFREVDPGAVEAVRREWGAGPGERVVGMVGRIGMGKGEDNFLGMAAMVREQVPGTRFAIVGGTFDRRDYLLDELRARAAGIGLGDAVTVTGLRDDMPAVMGAMDVVVHLPDRPESFGLSAAEGMAAGKPAVVAAMGALPEIVAHGETGYVVAPGDVEGAARYVAGLLGDDELRARMGLAGAELIEREFSVDRFAREFERVYLEVREAAWAGAAQRPVRRR
jgi:glycosyltransferase involved in cell wall biosynthesis